FLLLSWRRRPSTGVHAMPIAGCTLERRDPGTKTKILSGNAPYCMLSPMPLERLFTHRLIRILQFVLPLVVLVLIAIPSWNYWSRQKTPRSVPRKMSQLPKDLSLRTDDFNYSKMEGDRTLFTIHAKTNLGYSDNRNMLEDVTVTIFGQKPGEPP